MADQDPELQAIRAARLAQLQQGRAQGVNMSDTAEQDIEQKRKEEQMRRDMLATVLDSSARERLSRIALVNPNLSTRMEAILLRMASSGQIRSKVTEDQLIGLLKQAEDAQASSAPKQTISYQRRKAVDDDDDDFDL
ncbi:hypothetical protein FRB99_000960 [Tulasnella sp. 403]|nr:hypothetical protein FRB99_000960 [Tulasnella sp. 403]